MINGALNNLKVEEPRHVVSKLCAVLRSRNERVALIGAINDALRKRRIEC